MTRSKFKDGSRHPTPHPLRAGSRHYAGGMSGNTSIGLLESTTHEAMHLLEQNCWQRLPSWECYAANIAGLVSTGLWFVVLVPQVLKNWWRRSVEGLSFLWAVANFSASLINIFFAFWVEVPLYVKVSAVYMPILEFTILCQFMLYSTKPFTTRTLALLVCLLIWGTLIELELNFSDERDKLQWVAIVLWSVETFPQIMLNIRLQSTSGQSSISVIITLVGKTTDFIVNYGLNLPLPYVVMTYFSSSSAFINAFQVFWYGREKWTCKKTQTCHDDQEELLSDEYPPRHEHKMQTSLLKIISVSRFVGICYVIIGLVCFAVGLFWRTQSFFALLGPTAVLAVVVVTTEYYKMKKKGRLQRCEEIQRRVLRKSNQQGIGNTIQ